MRRGTEKYAEYVYTSDYSNQPSNQKIRTSPLSHLSNSIQYKDETPSSVRLYRKPSYGTPSQTETYARQNQRVEERKQYDPYSTYSSNRSIIEDTPKHATYSSTGTFNNNTQPLYKEPKIDYKDSTLKRQNSSHYKSYQTGNNTEKTYLEGSKAYSNTPSQVLKQQKIYSSTYISPFSQPPSYRRQTITPSDRRDSILRQIQLKQEQPYFQYILRYSYRSKRGFAPSNPAKLNQDAFITIPNINSQTFQHYFGVCDGHGAKGHLVSSFIKTKLPSMLGKIKNLKNPTQQLIQAYKNISDQLLEDQSIDTTYSGSTSVGCYLNHNKLYCCNVGDSRAIVGKKTKYGQWTAKQLSTDHKPCLPREAQRIIKNGGRIEAYKDSDGEPIGPQRVWFKDRNIPGLAMSRSFGDTIASPIGVISVPEVDQYTLSNQDKIVVIASDGLWQFLSNKQVIDIISPFYEQNKIQQSCNILLETAISKWKQESTCLDDITFVVLFLDYSFPKN